MVHCQNRLLLEDFKLSAIGLICQWFDKSWREQILFLSIFSRESNWRQTICGGGEEMFFENRTNGIWTSDIRHPVSLFFIYCYKIVYKYCKGFVYLPNSILWICLWFYFLTQVVRVGLEKVYQLLKDSTG